MKHSILIIDDEAQGATNLAKVFKKSRFEYMVTTATSEVEISDKIENIYYNIAIVDLRMDAFSINGFDIINKIIDVNPFAKIIIMSAYLPEFTDELAAIMKSGKVEGIVSKDKFDIFKDKILTISDKIVKEFEDNPLVNQKALESLYADAKNESDSYKKGMKFEQFVSVLFSQMGFNHIIKRFKDQSLNEVDLIIRNEIDDNFFQKFKPYILVECKNTNEDLDKNQFIQFRSKLEHAASMANLGVIITTKSIKHTTYTEAVRSSGQPHKIIFITNAEIKRLIYSNDSLYSFKGMIDEQIKDN